MDQMTTIDDLPDELIEMVLAEVEIDKFACLAAARLVCRRWYAASAALCKPVDAYLYGRCLQAYMDSHGGQRPSAAEGFDVKADVILWALTGMNVSVDALARPFDLATCMSDLGSDDDGDDGGSASDERCPRCAVHPNDCTCVIPNDPYDWPCGEPRPLLPGRCHDDVYENRYMDPCFRAGAPQRHLFEVRRTPPLSHWDVMTRSIDNAHGDTRAAALYVGRCCERLVGAGACSPQDIATSSCSAIVRRAHNFANDRLCRAGGKGYNWKCSCPCDTEAEAIFEAIAEGREMSDGHFGVAHDDDGRDDGNGPSHHSQTRCCTHNFFDSRCRVGGVRHYYDSHNVEIQPDFDLDATEPAGGITAY
ncbi:F-box incomplete domain containing protein [Pandoravirus celtis]|uniref:F-box incomplete domain containing protein n=1 Tax=Pandoravirus celtis TaxID=2568002 RepID=A0A4D6EHI2_9VIRU|nr:F-box incomplete domain containing protein [Pandoravirus celtis]